MPKQKQSLKVFLSCALGALVGGLVARQFDYNALVGMMVGFCAGYLIRASKQIIAAIPEAWQEAKAEFASWQLPTIASAEWRAFRHILKIRFEMYGLSFSLAVSGVSIGWAMFRHYGVLQTGLQAMIFVSCSLIPAVSGMSMSMINALPFVRKIIRSNFRTILYGRKLIRQWALWTNPVSTFLIVFVGIPLLAVILPCAGLAWLIYAVQEHGKSCLRFCGEFFTAVGRSCKRFLKSLFYLVHSDELLLCAVDAAIGAGLGCYFRNPLAGALIGGLWGLANFEFISIRKLKLFPIERSLFHR